MARAPPADCCCCPAEGRRFGKEPGAQVRSARGCRAAASCPLEAYKEGDRAANHPQLPA